MHTHNETSEKGLFEKGTNLTPHKHTVVTDTLNVSLAVTGDENHLPKHPLSRMQVCFFSLCLSVCESVSPPPSCKHP